MKKLAIVLAVLFVVSSVMATGGHTIDEISDCFGGYVCVSATCEGGTSGTLIFTEDDTFGDVNDGVEAFCGVTEA